MRWPAVFVVISWISLATPASAELYSGGTLHRSTGRQWKAASAQNRLATAADFVAKVAKPSSIDDLREKAQELQICISEAVAGPPGDGQEVSGIAAACVILMGYVR
jgi:hypothetical protein